MTTKNYAHLGGSTIIPLSEHDWNESYHVNKFGRNPAIGSGDTNDIWDYGATADLAWPSAAAATTIISGEAADDGDPEGTGARTVQVQGLDGSYNLLSETVTMNGISAVTLSNQFLRVFRAKVMTAGSGAANAGAIDVKHGAAILARITAGNNQTLMCCYTVPAGYTAYLLGYYATMNRSVVTGATDIRILARPTGAVFQLKKIIGLAGTGVNAWNYQYQIPPAYAEKTDIYMDATPTVANTDISAGFDLFVVKNV